MVIGKNGALEIAARRCYRWLADSCQLDGKKTRSDGFRAVIEPSGWQPKRTPAGAIVCG